MTVALRTLEEAYQLTHDPPVVLVVEDDVDVLSSIAEVIREEGFLVATAANGYQALAQLDQHVPDLIFLDLMMPQMNGWRFLEEMRRRFPDAGTPVVLLSAATHIGDEAVQLGVRHFLRKPVELDQIVTLAHRLIDIPPPQQPPPSPVGTA